MRFKIINKKPFLVGNDNKLYKVRWDSEGFTVGEEYIEDRYDIPEETHGELGVIAKCETLDSISEEEKVPKKKATKKKTNKE